MALHLGPLATRTVGRSGRCFGRACCPSSLSLVSQCAPTHGCRNFDMKMRPEPPQDGGSPKQWCEGGFEKACQPQWNLGRLWVTAPTEVDQKPHMRYERGREVPPLHVRPLRAIWCATDMALCTQPLWHVAAKATTGSARGWPRYGGAHVALLRCFSPTTNQRAMRQGELSSRSAHWASY